jgi:hypothetical protein
VSARTFWIALPVAVVLALWLGPGLARQEQVPADDAVEAAPDSGVAPGARAAEVAPMEVAPGDASTGTPAVGASTSPAAPVDDEIPALPPPVVEPECEPPPDYGPDGDG